MQETDLSVPARRGPWWYVTRTEEGKQYPIFCRRPSPDDEENEIVLLDGNELAGDSPFFALGTIDVSPDHNLLAFSTDYDGAESYTLRFKNLVTGETLADTVEGTYYGSAWATDNATFFYTTIDDAHRPYRLWRHRLGTPSSDDVLVYEENDERFFLSVELTRSEQYIVVCTSAARSRPRRTCSTPPRRRASSASSSPAGKGSSTPSTTRATASSCCTTTARSTSSWPRRRRPRRGGANWRPLIAHRDDTRLMDVDAFAGHLVVHLRRNALTGLRVVRNDGDAHEIEFDEPLFSVEPGANLEYETTTFRLGYESFVTPPTVYDYDLDQRDLELRKQQPVLGGYDPADYTQTREWATAADGTRVPISVVHRANVAHDGQAPCLLYGYGSYETSLDPWFSAIRLPMLDRGMVFAVAHVRGGGECGRQWYEDGKLLHKRNTFTDFIACAEHLCAEQYTSPERLAARGGSAGGLLMGAVANLAPQQFAAILAEVPFVDALNTILDPSLPLTVIEWEEWGNPDRVGRGVPVHEVVLAVRERRGEGLSGDPRDRRPERSACRLSRAREVGGEAARDQDRRSAVAAQDRDGCRPRRPVRSL